MAEYNESICRSCLHSYVCEKFNKHRDSYNQKCHFYNDHFVPADDVSPVRHGRWVLDEKRYVVYCSECSAPVSYYPNIKDVREENHYCPNCGAKMDLEG